MTILQLILIMFMMTLGGWVVVGRHLIAAGQWRLSLGVLLCLSALTGIIYCTLGSGSKNMRWLAELQHHRKLMAQLAELGPIDDIILDIEARLKQNPDDEQGHYLLGRLYEVQGNQQAAEKAVNLGLLLKKVS